MAFRSIFQAWVAAGRRDTTSVHGCSWSCSYWCTCAHIWHPLQQQAGQTEQQSELQPCHLPCHLHAHGQVVPCCCMSTSRMGQLRQPHVAQHAQHAAATHCNSSSVQCMVSCCPWLCVNCFESVQPANAANRRLRDPTSDSMSDPYGPASRCLPLLILPHLPVQDSLVSSHLLITRHLVRCCMRVLCALASSMRGGVSHLQGVLGHPMLWNSTANHGENVLIAISSAITRVWRRVHCLPCG